MVYTPHTWVNGTSALSAAHFNNIEAGVDDVDNRVTSLEAGGGGGAAGLSSNNTWTGANRFRVGPPHVDPTAWSVPTDGTTAASSAIQTMVNTIPAGSIVRWPPNTKYRIDATITIPATHYGLNWESGGGRSYNESTSGMAPATFIGDAGVNVLRIGDA